jgi:hypothetical protein
MRISIGDSFGSFFQFHGPCGGGLVDYYRRSDGSVETYTNGANRNRIEKCYPVDDCTFTSWVGQLVCYA